MSEPIKQEPTLAQMAEALRAERDNLTAQMSVVVGERDVARADLEKVRKEHADAITASTAALTAEQTAHKATCTARDTALAELAAAKAKLTGPAFDAAASAKATTTPPPANAGTEAGNQSTPKTSAELEKAYAALPDDPVVRAKWRKEHLKIKA